MTASAVSVLIPVYNEVDAIAPLCSELRDALNQLGCPYEIVVVNDGSTDGTADLLDRLAREHDSIKVLHLRRNFGQTAALMAAIQHASGEILIPMDGDGQNDPADLPRLVAKLEEGFDVVSGWRRQRMDRAITRRLPSHLANRLISLLTGVKLNDYGCTLKAYRRDILQGVRLYGEAHRFIPVYAAWQGARVTEIPVGHRPRETGVSKYGLGRVPRVLLDLVLLYFFDRALDRPLQFFGKIGLVSLLLAVAVGVWAVWLKLAHETSFIQTPLPLLVVLLTLLAILCILLGLVAELIMRVYFESRGAPVYAIRAIRNLDSLSPREWPARLKAASH
jgi:glycosyltransferase involved in cell wall biosynthesis